jgi:cellulose synthase/poly-beta-1,6-N-acetylglucosamine synthase-like glycosyltransferase
MLLLVLAAQAAAIILLAFSARRALLLAAACLPSEQPSADLKGAGAAQVLILVPGRNEAAALPGLFRALDHLDYPREALRAIVVDDGSTDDTARLARAWAAGRPWAAALSLPANRGKAQALNDALASELHPGFKPELIAIYDADHHPAPGALIPLAAPFVRADVGAASGQMRVSNGLASPAAAYAMIESLVNQFVTMRAKDRLRLAPAVLGSNCAYRASALRAVGRFQGGALLEDSDLTLALALAGWRTRFVPESISDHNAPLSVSGYVRQHLRWNRGFHQVAGGRLGAVWRNPRLSLPLKLELTFFTFGYADRLALLAALLFTLADLVRPGLFRFPPIVWAIYFGVPAFETLAALVLARERPAAYLRLVYVPAFFALDIVIAAWSAAQSLLRRPLRWGATERPTPIAARKTPDA